MASTYLTFTQQTPSTAEAQKFTISMWVKRCGLASIQGLYGNTYSNTHRGYLYFDSSDRFVFFDSSGTSLVTSRKFRDITGFYHIVVATDTTQGTAANRVKIYVNGVQETAFDTETYPNQNQDLKIMNTTNTPYMGRIVEAGTSYYLDGVLSHVHFTQGYVYQASDFGSTDATTGQWKINTSPTISNYGTNGFWWLKDSIATTDHSPNSNTFTVGGGTLTKTEDCPSNVFATLNPLDTYIGGTKATFSNGNTQWSSAGNSSSNGGTRMTLGLSTGKCYFEAKLLQATETVIAYSLDSVTPFFTATGYTLDSSATYGLYINGSDNLYAIVGGTNQNNNLGSVSNNDIIGVAFDFDNGKFYFSKNGSWLNSGDPTSGATGTGSFGNLPSGTYLPSISNASWSISSSTSFNFGNGYFGTTAVSSAGTNASGIGIFEYDVPTGYTALSTKGLNE